MKSIVLVGCGTAFHSCLIAKYWLEKNTKITGFSLTSGKPGGFIYGADIAEFELYKTKHDVRSHMEFVHGLFNRIENLHVPTAVGIDGIAVGGGLEIALAFDFITTTSSKNFNVLRAIFSQ